MQRLTIRVATPLALVASLTLFGSAASATSGATRLVPSEYPTIQAAIDASASGDTVLVAPGTYTGAGNRDMSFLGKDIVVRSMAGAQQTIIDCQASFEDPHRAFLFQAGETRAAVLDGFTITGGSTLPGAISDEFNGGAVLMVNASPTLANCIFRENQGGCWGGAVYSGFSGSPLIIGCMFVDNYVGDDGGGFFTWAGANPVIESCVFMGNHAAANGGAIAAFWGGDVTIRQTTMVGNTAPWASGMLSFSTTGTVSNSIIWGNTGSSQEASISTSIRVTDSNIRGGQTGAGNINTNPRFLEDGYHLSPFSPCIDAGNSNLTPALGALDIDGNVRVSGSRVDMGADEFMGRTRLSKATLR